jgi:hypothetical protein
MGNKAINAVDVLGRVQGLQQGNNQFDGYCDQFAESAVAGRIGIYGDAKEYQDWARKQKALNTTTYAPAGVPVFFNTSNPHKHVAVSAGSGYVYSTGIGGKIKKVKQDYFGGYAGWTSAIKGKGNSVDYIDYKSTGAKGALIPAASVSRGSAAGFAEGAVGSGVKLPTNIGADSYIPRVS